MFILQGPAGRRVILGSANLSHAAFSGRQGEHLVVFDDDPGMYATALRIYEEQLQESDPILPQFFEKQGPVEVSELPAFERVVGMREALVIEPSKLGPPGTSPSASDPIICLIKTEELRKNFANALPTASTKAVLTTAEHIRKTGEQAGQIKTVRGIERREIPNLQGDPERGEVRLGGHALDLNPSEMEVKNDARLIDEFMRGYRTYFSGKVDELIQDYSASMTWIFAAPFISPTRTAALRNDFNVLHYPACRVLYGKSNAGKTDLTKVMLRAMFGQEWWLDIKDFNATTFYAVAARGGSFRIVVDDISSEKFRDPAKVLIKRDHQTGTFPVLVLSTNQDVRAVDPDVLKRALVVHADASAPVTLASANSFVAQVNRRLGTALYRRYLGRIVAAWPAFMSEFHAPQAGADGIINSANAADLIKLSNSMLSAVLNEALEPRRTGTRRSTSALCS